MATPRIATPRRRVSPAYSRVEQLISREQCVILDGGIATELEGLETPGYKLSDDSMWGSWALLNAPEAVMRVHRAYAEVGCDIVSTDTWGIQSDLTALGGPSGEPAADWMELARRGIRLARRATAEQGRGSDCAVAFSLHGDVADDKGLERLELLTRVFEDEPPDLVLLETMSLIRDRTLEGVQTLIASGFPVWLSFRRCRHGLCGVFGQHWGGPEGDLFGRAARKFEDMGVGALMINCIPPDHVQGMLPWLRDFTDLPLGVYPNLGYYTESGWSFDQRIGGSEYADLAADWREEGAQIIGGCCGVRPHHLSAARAKLNGTRPGPPAASARGLVPRRRRPVGVRAGREASRAVARRARAAAVSAAGAGARGRARRLRPDAGQLPALEAPVRRRDRQGQELPRRRLRHRPADDAARAQRGQARARDRHRPPGRGEHPQQRVPQRASPTASAASRSTSTRGCRRTASTSSSRASTRCRTTPSSSSRATARSTTGAAACSTTCSGCCPSC